MVGIREVLQQSRSEFALQFCPNTLLHGKVSYELPVLGAGLERAACPADLGQRHKTRCQANEETLGSFNNPFLQSAVRAELMPLQRLRSVTKGCLPLASSVETNPLKLRPAGPETTS